MQNPLMSPMPGFESRWRLLTALLLSAALHLVVLTGVPFRQTKMPPLPELKDWRVDVTLESRGEGAASQTAAPQLRPEKSSPAERTARMVSPALSEQSTTAAARLAAPPMFQPAAEQAAEQQAPAVRQARAFEGAMNNLVNMQYLLIRMKAFYELSHEHIKSSVRGLLTEEQMRRYGGAVCTATLTYATSGSEEDVQLDCGAMQELADLLSARIDWNALPQPEKYFLDYRSLSITFWFDGYQIRVGLKSED